MGGVEGHARETEAEQRRSRGQTPLRVRARPKRQTDAAELIAHEGEVIGLAGLAGHGQTDLLLAIFAGSRRARAGIEVTTPAALVAGDRQADGIFPDWSIAENIGVCSLNSFRQGLLISPRREDSAGRPLARQDRDPHARRARQHPVAVGRQPAEGAVRPRARLGGAHRADGRSDARRRYRHQARGLRSDRARKPAPGGPSSGTPPKPTN